MYDAAKGEPISREARRSNDQEQVGARTLRGSPKPEVAGSLAFEG
jgi:hypothetical protein